MESYHLKMTADMRRDIAEVLPRIVVALKEGTATAYQSDFIRLAIEHALGELSAGKSILEHTVSYPNAVQLAEDGERIQGVAPVSSAKDYAALVENPGIPNPRQRGRFERDARMINKGCRVICRGDLWGSPGTRVRKEGTVKSKRVGLRPVFVDFDDGVGATMQLFDLVRIAEVKP